MPVRMEVMKVVTEERRDSTLFVTEGMVAVGCCCGCGWFVVDEVALLTSLSMRDCDCEVSVR